MNSNYQTLTCNNSSSDNSNFNNERIHCTPTYSIIHNFLDVAKIMEYENIIYYIAPSQDFHLLGLFKDKHLEEQNFPILFYGQLQQIF